MPARACCPRRRTEPTYTPRAPQYIGCEPDVKPSQTNRSGVLWARACPVRRAKRRRRKNKGSAGPPDPPRRQAPHVAEFARGARSRRSRVPPCRNHEREEQDPRASPVSRASGDGRSCASPTLAVAALYHREGLTQRVGILAPARAAFRQARGETTWTCRGGPRAPSASWASRRFGPLEVRSYAARARDPSPRREHIDLPGGARTECLELRREPSLRRCHSRPPRPDLDRVGHDRAARPLLRDADGTVTSHNSSSVDLPQHLCRATTIPPASRSSPSLERTRRDRALVSPAARRVNTGRPS